MEFQNSIILYQIAILAILVAIGVVASHLKVITEGGKKGLANIVFDITLPLLIITTFAKLEMNTEILRNSGLVFLFAYLALGTMYLWGRFSAGAIGIKGKSRAVFLNHHMFGNIVFLGFPLMDALFPGGEGLLYAAVFQLASNSILWTSGVYIFLKGSGNSKREVWRNMLNTNTFAFFIGIGIMLLKVKIPSVIFEPLAGLGTTTIYLSMLYIGAMLYQTKVSGILKNRAVWVVTLNRLIIVPTVLAFAVYFIASQFIPEFSDTARKVVLLEAAMPCMATIVVMANKFGSDDRLATENVFLSTILSLLTIPLIYSGLLLLDRLFF